MTAPQLLALFGLILSLAGSIILAYSLNGLLSSLTLAVSAHDVTIENLVHPNADVPVFTGLDTHVTRGEKSARARTALGIVMIGVGSALQAGAVLIAVF